MPTGGCLRCKDVAALLSEYRRLAPLALTMAATMRHRQPLGGLAHLAAEQLRARDVDRILSEYQMLQALPNAR